MFDTVEEIKTAISKREGDMNELHQRMDDDFDLLTLEEFEPVAGYEKYTSASPRNFFDKVVDGLNRAVLDLRIRLPEDAKNKEKKSAILGEQYLLGALGNIDRTLRMRGEKPLRQALSFLMGARGWILLRALVYVPKGEKETVFDVQPWDARHATWQEGATGLVWAAFKRNLSATQIKDEYDIDIGKAGEGEVIDFFDRDRNSIIVQDEFFKEPTDHKIGHVPVFVGAAGSMPSMQPGLNASGSSTISGSLLKHRGDSVWHSSRGQYKPWNKYVSGLMDTAKKSLVGSLIHASKDGKKKLQGDPHESFMVIPIAHGKESIEPLLAPTAPPEVAALLRVIGANIQQSTLPDPLSFGGTEAPESGRALSIRIEATRSVFNPYTSLLGDAYTWLAEELLAQFAQKGLNTADLKGFNRDNEFFRVQIKPKDIDEGWFVMATVEPRLPRDEELEVQMAIAATSSRGDEQPLMSKHTAREAVLKMRDPFAEEDRILSEKGMSLPPIVVRRMAAALKRRGRPDLADEVMALLEQEQGTQATSQQLPPEVLESVVQILVQTGNQQVAESLLQALGVQTEGTTAPPASQGAPPMAAGIPPKNEGVPPESQGIPTEVIQLLQEIVKVLTSAGRGELAREFVGILEAGQPPEPTMVEDIIDVLITQGREDLAQALLQLLGVNQVPEQGVTQEVSRAEALPPKE
jgi:hypothetical protein